MKTLIVLVLLMAAGCRNHHSRRYFGCTIDGLTYCDFCAACPEFCDEEQFPICGSPDGDENDDDEDDVDDPLCVECGQEIPSEDEGIAIE